MLVVHMLAVWSVSEASCHSQSEAKCEATCQVHVLQRAPVTAKLRHSHAVAAVLMGPAQVANSNVPKQLCGRTTYCRLNQSCAKQVYDPACRC
jgi:hypothetical protein